MSFARLYNPLRVRSTDVLDDVLRMVEDVLSDEQECKRLLEVRGDEAQKCLDALQLLADGPNVAGKLRSSILKMMLHLSKRSGLCPKCLIIKNVKKLGAFPVGGGGFGDVWKGKIEEQLVCLKVVKVYLRSDVTHLMNDYMREAIVWQQLKHPNLLPFVGMYYLDKTREQLCLVSPWMERGDLMRYLKAKSRKDIDHQALAYDVAAGLSYLHEKKIVHGDLKCVNILVTPDERACIGDFGLSRVADSRAVRLSTSTPGQSRGTVRWLSPELLEPQPCQSSTRSDIYAYACVCYEIFTGKAPFSELVDGAVIVAIVLHKMHPARPENVPELTNSMWEIMESCWAHDPNLRPTAEDVLSRVGALRSMKTGELVRQQPAPDWNSLNLMQIWKNVKYPAVDTAALARLLQKGQTGTVAVRPSPSLGSPISSVFSFRRDTSIGPLNKPLPTSPPHMKGGVAPNGEDENILTPHNSQHNLHVGKGLKGSPPSPAISLTEAGFTEEKVVAIQARAQDGDPGVQLDTNDESDSINFENEDFWPDDSWQAEFGPHINSRRSLNTTPSPLTTPLTPSFSTESAMKVGADAPSRALHPLSPSPLREARSSVGMCRVLPLVKSNLPRTTVSVTHSCVVPDEQGKEAMSFRILVQPGGAKASWQVEKPYTQILELNRIITKSFPSLAVVTIPDRVDGKLWKGENSPAQMDERKAALQRYLQSLITIPLNYDEVIAFLTSNVTRDFKPPASKEGYLAKRGKNFDSWKWRYFVLKNLELEYFDYRDGKRLGFIHLTEASIEKQRGPSGSGPTSGGNGYRHDSLFVLEKNDQQARHVFCAESDEERDSWVDALTRQIGRAGKKSGTTVFGVSLEESLDVAQIANLPAVVFRCMEFLEAKNGIQETLIYRSDGRSSIIDSLKDRFDLEGDVDLVASEEHYGPHDIASLLKAYLRELPTPILTRSLRSKFVYLATDDPPKEIDELSQMIASLPNANYSLIRALAAHLDLVVQNSRINKMRLSILEICFASTLKIPSGLFRVMIEHFERVFRVDENEHGSVSGPLQSDKDVGIGV
ncbi:Rho guanine nucleotide exchange factor [Marasmius crinis-equi]|uniref:Rho guanine nucleotide exchange factor n=1 Tax=Marasmius crinis-equi TaxID=585013 RepID=A0ABR3FC00_9AGAR